MTIGLTAELLRELVSCTPAVAERYAADLARACEHYGITATPLRLAHFVAQVGHESAGMMTVTESLNYSVDGLLAGFGRHRISEADARRLGRQPGRAADQEGIAHALYGGEWGRRNLGNTEFGDGWRYRGRGLIQTTGRANYARLRDRLRQAFGAAPVPDFEAAPVALELPQWAAWSAADYWAMRGINALADNDDLEAVTRAVNGGSKGLVDRRQRLLRALNALAGQGHRLHNLHSPAPVAAPLPAPPPVQAPAPDPDPPPAAAPAVPDTFDTPQETAMPLPAFVAAALPAIVANVPRLARMFGSGSEVSERNIRAAELVVDIAREVTGAPNAQAAAEAVQASPDAARAVAKAIEQRWLEVEEAGGGGIDGAGKRDAGFRASGDRPWHSPSFLIALGLMPMVYMVLSSVLYGIGPEWPSDVRAAIATAVVSLVTGGLMGYYFGQTTSRNRTAA